MRYGRCKVQTVLAKILHAEDVTQPRVIATAALTPMDTLSTLGIAGDTLVALAAAKAASKGHRRGSFELAAIAGVDVGGSGGGGGGGLRGDTPPCLDDLQSAGLQPSRVWEDWAAFTIPVAGGSECEEGATAEVYIHLPSGEGHWIAPVAALLPPEIRAVRLVLLLAFNPYKPGKSQPLSVCGDVSLYLDPELMKPYYCIERSGASSWEPPAELWDESMAFVPPLAVLSGQGHIDGEPVDGDGSTATTLCTSNTSELGASSAGSCCWLVFRDNRFMMQVRTTYACKLFLAAWEALVEVHVTISSDERLLFRNLLL